VKEKPKPDCAAVNCIRTATTEEEHLIFNSQRRIIKVPLCDKHKEQS
jgi:hypothetical protein